MSDAARQPKYSLFIEKNNQFNSYFEPSRHAQIKLLYDIFSDSSAFFATFFGAGFSLSGTAIFDCVVELSRKGWFQRK